MMSKTDFLWQSTFMRQALRFTLSTAISASLSFGLPVLLVEAADFNEQRAVQISFAAAYLVNLFMLRTFVFRSDTIWHKDVLRYIFVNAGFRLTEYSAFTLLFATAEIQYMAALLIVLVISTLVKFFAYRLIFKPSNSEVRAP